MKGNITVIPAALRPNSQSLTTTWDFDNRMINADVGSNGSIEVSHKYDALGRRVARTDTATTIFVPSGQQTIADYASGAAPSSSTYRYLCASYIDEPVLRFTTSGSVSHYLHRNHQYSVYAITNSSAGIVERYAYTAYGAPSFFDGSGNPISNSSMSNRISYTSREWDSIIQQYHFRARMYEATLGRFCGRDPIAYEGSESNTFNLYNAGMALNGLDANGTSVLRIACLSQHTKYCEDECQKQQRVAKSCVCFRHTIGPFSFTSVVPGCRDKPKNCGACTPQELSWLQAAKDAACTGAGRPTPGMSCDDLRLLGIKNGLCWAARSRIQDKCFSGKPDAIHPGLIEQHKQWGIDAYKYYYQKPCPNMPEHPYGADGPIIT